VGPVARAALLAALLAAAGCGSDRSAPAQPRYDVTVTYWPAGAAGESRSATLTCDPDGGSHPDPVKACAALLSHEDALKPVSGGVACTEVYGGPQQASIVGADVNARFSRTNGCEIARWEALAPVLELTD
jgi:Subtilisin inhibitor-like